jgi:hypothetical protein
MNKEIKYIGFYDFPDSKIKRVSNLAATNKMDYICEAIHESGINVHLISPSWTTENQNSGKFLKQTTINITKWKKITYCPSFNTKNKLTRNIKIIFSLIWLFCWLVINIKKNEKILMYHVPWLSIPVRWARNIKKFKLILEVEEIYGDVSVIHPYFYTLEKKLIAAADAYLFSTDLLADKFGKTKPFVVIYGAYKTYPQLSSPPDDGKIHLLYAGIIDTHKAGAFNAIEAARLLSDKYVLHIIGFGNISLLEEKIKEVNKLNGCKVSYDGIFSGEDYVKFCQTCHIGLSTQNMEGKYLASSFPSKILSYLGMGLNVVSGRIECVSSSKIGNIINYYDDTNYQNITDAIKGCRISSPDEKITLIIKLNDEFVKNINMLLLNK